MVIMDEKLHVIQNGTQEYSFWDFKGKFEFVDDWFLMRSPVPLGIITVAYLLFVLKLGPDYLKNKKPFELKNVLLLYNGFQVGLSAWMMTWAFKEMLVTGPIQRTCMTDTEESKVKLATLIYCYFSCKITELLDTVFFVLRKKQNQVTFLHVYHHTLMIWNGWVFLKYEPGYWMLFLGCLNSFVHVIMYGYYGLSTYPSLTKYLWWKKYITSLQLVQFGLVITQMTINLIVNECRISQKTIYYFYINGALFIYLFSDFYRKSYSNTSKKSLTVGNDNGLKSKSLKNQFYDEGLKLRNGKQRNEASFSSDFEKYSKGTKKNHRKI